MNYLYIILLVVIFFIVYINHYPSKNIYVDLPDIKGNKEDNISFVKPEHKLLKILNNVSVGSKIRLDGKCTQYIYNKNTINSELKDRIIYIIKDILCSLNSISGYEYYIKTIENIYVSIDRKNNQRYIVDYFIYDTRNYYTLRLISDIVIIDEDIYINYIHIQSGSNSALLNKYDFKLNSIGILLDGDMFHNDITNIFDNYYTSNFNVIGINDTNLEYNSEDISSVYSLNSLKNIMLPANVSNDTYKELNKKGLSSYLEMYLPKNQNNIKSKSFCDKYDINWDNYGIKNETDKQDKHCYLNNNQLGIEINEPWFGPGVINDRVSNNNYEWINSYSRKNILKSQ